MDGGEMMISLDLEQPQQKQQRTGNPVAADRSVSETRYYSDDATITGDICDKEEGRLLLAGACDSREDGGASMRRSAAEATATGDGHGTSSGSASATGCGDADDFGEVEEGKGDDGEPSLWSALAFAWVSALPAWLAVRMGARRVLQLADLPPPPRTCRAEWLDAQTARLQGEGRKEEELWEGGQAEKRGERRSGQSVVSGGWRDDCPEGAVARAGGMDGAVRHLRTRADGGMVAPRGPRWYRAVARIGRLWAGGRRKWPLWAALYWPHRWQLLLLAVLFLGESMLQVGKAVLLYQMIAYLEACGSSSSVAGQPAPTEGYVMAAGLGAVAVVMAVVSQQLSYRSYVVSTNTHTAAISAVHRHLLSLTASALSHVSSGHCINLLSNDVRRLEDLVFFGNALWVAPIELAMVTWLIAREIGWVPTVAGIGTQLLLLPLQQLACGKWGVRLREQTAEATDARVKHTEEALGGIMTVKILALERVFTAIIERLRRTEVSFLQSTAAINAVSDALYFSFTSVVALVTFATLTCLGGQLTASSVFYVLTLLEVRASLFSGTAVLQAPHKHPHVPRRATHCLLRVLRAHAARGHLNASSVFYVLTLLEVRASLFFGTAVLQAPHKHPHVPRRAPHHLLHVLRAHAARGACFLAPQSSRVDNSATHGAVDMRVLTAPTHGGVCSHSAHSWRRVFSQSPLMVARVLTAPTHGGLCSHSAHSWRRVFSQRPLMEARVLTAPTHGGTCSHSAHSWRRVFSQSPLMEARVLTAPTHGGACSHSAHSWRRVFSQRPLMEARVLTAPTHGGACSHSAHSWRRVFSQRPLMETRGIDWDGHRALLLLSGRHYQLAEYHLIPSQCASACTCLCVLPALQQTKPHGATHKGAPSQSGYAALLPEARHYALEAIFESTQGANSQHGSALLPEERHYAIDTQTTTTKPLKSSAAALTAPSLQSPPSLELASLPCHSLSSSSAPTRLPSTPRAALVLEGASFSWGEAVGEARCEGEMEDEEKGEGLSRRRESHALQVASAGHVFDLSETPSTGYGCTDDGCRGYGTGYGTGYNRSSCSINHVPSAFRMCFPQWFMGSHAAGLSPAAASASSSAADAAAVSAPVTAQGGQEGQKEMGWRDDAPSGRVEGVSVRLGEAELLGVTGKTGSGKSLLLLGILGEVPLSSGAMHRSVPSLAYASQQPLLIEGTVRDNILFGTPLDEALYAKVLDACALRSDLALWPRGDASLVEEGGGNLSGGQRARVSLARAAYASLHCKMTSESAYATLDCCSATPQLHADSNGGCDNRHSNSRDNRSNDSSSNRGAPPPVLVLLDDPLAALDPAIACHVFQQCVCGLLAGLPRIVVTHQVQYLGRVLLLDDDTAAACGAWSDLCALPSAQQHWENHPPGPDFSDVSNDSDTCSDSAVCATDSDSDSEFDSCSSTETDEDGTLAGTQSCRCKNGTMAAYVSSSSGRSSSSSSSSSSSVCSVDCDRSSDSDMDAPTDSTDDCPLIRSEVVVEKAEAERGLVNACRERESISNGGQLAEGLLCESGEPSAATELRGGEEGVLEASGSTEGDDEQGLLDVEGWQHGAIPMSVFWGYARQMGVLPLLLVAALFLAAHVSNCLASWFLGMWTGTPHTIHHPLLTLTAIALSCVALSLLASLLFHRAALRASSRLHSRMLASVLASPLAFFHRNPTGRLLNRFSEDLGVTDDVLPEMLLGFVNSVGLCIAAVVSACIAVPWTLIPVLPLLLLLLQLRHLYVCTAREVRRMECTTRSVLLSRFLASMEGLPTIRAFSQQRRFHHLFLRHVTANATPHLFWLATWEWLGFRLDLLVAAALLSAALAAVALRHSLPPAMAALALSYLLQLPDSLRWALQYGAELENT
ncbi:unnamed protein product, partial [Closterium sp. NIES-53]